MDQDPTLKKNLKDQENYIRAISFLCKKFGSKRTCIIHYIERLNRYYGIPAAFREVYPRYRVEGKFRFRICEYIAELREITYKRGAS